MPPGFEPIACGEASEARRQATKGPQGKVKKGARRGKMEGIRRLGSASMCGKGQKIKGNRGEKEYDKIKR